MNIYDFDGTIYNGDSSIDFFLFCIKKNKKCLLIIPKLSLMIISYKLKLIKKEEVKSVFFSIIKNFKNLDEVVEEFWDNHISKIKDFYLKTKNETDIIISASPEFLLKPVSEQLSFKLIATLVDNSTGKIIGENCYGEEKVKRLKEMGITSCGNFFSDSLSDEPCSKLAKKAFLVKGEKILPWK